MWYATHTRGINDYYVARFLRKNVIDPKGWNPPQTFQFQCLSLFLPVRILYLSCLRENRMEVRPFYQILLMPVVNSTPHVYEAPKGSGRIGLKVYKLLAFVHFISYTTSHDSNAFNNIFIISIHLNDRCFFTNYLMKCNLLNWFICTHQ